MAVETFLFLATLTSYRSFGCDCDLRTSISAYYYHNNRDFPMKDLFIGDLSAVGALLIAYQGCNRLESSVLNAAGVALLLVVFFPMDRSGDITRISACGWVHCIGAVLFFACIGYLCLFRSQDTLGSMVCPRRREFFALLYRLVGSVMTGVPALAVALYCLSVPSYLYWIEYGGGASFWLYWVIKTIELDRSELTISANTQDRFQIPEPEQPNGLANL